MQQRVSRLRQRHLVVRLKDPDKDRDNKVAQRPRAKPELALKPLLKARGVREVSGRVNRSRRQAVQRPALPGRRGRNHAHQDKAPNQEFRAKVLSKRKCRSHCRVRSRAGQPELNGKVLRVRLLASKEVSGRSRAERSHVE